ncbi:MAG: molybdenum cofactor biosynthesis protein MoaE [Micrococcales bacterium]|nr:molybdenum cofactor biosynthesis protein MoaE [Micrococcales bacterium]
MPETSNAEPGRVALCAVREEALSADEVLAAVADPACGGVVIFHGLVRNHDDGSGVESLDYSAHPQASTELERVCREVAERHTGTRIAAVHRVGALALGDAAVITAAAAAHRGQAFEACRDLIDTLKAQVPIWKHQRYDDGRDSWVGLP